MRKVALREGGREGLNRMGVGNLIPSHDLLKSQEELTFYRFRDLSLVEQGCHSPLVGGAAFSLSFVCGAALPPLPFLVVLLSAAFRCFPLLWCCFPLLSALVWCCSLPLLLLGAACFHTLPCAWCCCLLLLFFAWCCLPPPPWGWCCRSPNEVTHNSVTKLNKVK